MSGGPKHLINALNNQEEETKWPGARWSTPVTEVEFVDGDEASDVAAQNYQKQLKDTVQNAAQGLLLHTIKDAHVESVSVAEIKAGTPMRGFKPMTLANMRANGVRMVTASCANCGAPRPTSMPTPCRKPTVPEAGQRLCCSQCGAKTISTRPAWHTASQRPGVPDFRPERPPRSQRGLPSPQPRQQLRYLMHCADRLSPARLCSGRPCVD